MARLSKNITEGKRIIAYYQIGIIFPDGKKIMKPRCNLEELFNTYFINLDKYINENPEELYNKYIENYKNKEIKVGINYIDSWGHKWSGKCAWPRKEKFIEFLNNYGKNTKTN